MRRADRNLVEPLSNFNAWATSWDGRVAGDPAGDAAVGVGSLRLNAAIASGGPPQILNAIGPLPNGRYAVTPGDIIVAAIATHIITRTGATRLTLQVDFWTAAGAYISSAAGASLTALGPGQVTMDGALTPANAASFTLNLVAADGAGTINVYVGQPQLYIGVGALPPYKAPHGLSPSYDVRLGPLEFTWPSDTLEETLGDTLDAVGAALTPSERRPRPLKLPVRIEGAPSEPTRAVGDALRRQVRQLLENRARLQEGLYLWLRADDDLAGWIKLGGGTIRESDPGASFGIYDLELESPYLVGRPATHIPGRRLDLADRRTGLVPIDTRGRLYHASFSSQAIPVQPLMLPGDTINWKTSRPRAGGSAGNVNGGPRVAGRRLWLAATADDGEVWTYAPDAGAFPHAPSAPLLVDEPGAVRIWDRTGGIDPNVAPSAQGDLYPDALFGWERVLGAQLRNTRAPLAIDNGAIRLVWVSDTLGLAFEWFDATLGRYRREGHINNDVTTYREAAIVEATSERAVVAWRSGDTQLRVILQRGWRFCRVEAYNDNPDTAARVVYTGLINYSSITTTAPAHVRNLNTGSRTVYYAMTTEADVFSSSTAWASTTRAGGTVVAQIASPASSADEVARWSAVDARSVPVLVGRA